MNPNISFAVITQELKSSEPMADFLTNARKHGHRIYSLIIGYQRDVDQEVVGDLSRYTDVQLIRVGGSDPRFRVKMLEAGVSEEDYRTVFISRNLDRYGRITYARNRNTVLAAALLNGTDHLYSFDTDIQPRLLVADSGDGSGRFPSVGFREIDFVGSHEEYLSRDDVFVSTSDYSGYYILPPMEFDGLEDLLIGIQKQAAYDFLTRCGEHHCLNLATESRHPRPTRKILGGNFGIDLSKAGKFSPFYSTFMMFDGEPVLGRGEDTLMGYEISQAGGICMDVDLWVFHNTFGDFPKIPDTREQNIRDRLYRGSLGWLARNPFLNWFRRQKGFEKRSLPELFEYQREHLVRGSRAAAEALADRRFLRLPAAFDLSVSLLDQMVDEFEQLSSAWDRVVLALQTTPPKRRAPREENDGHSQLLGPSHR
jgi:hypothetical protein